MLIRFTLMAAVTATVATAGDAPLQKEAKQLASQLRVSAADHDFGSQEGRDSYKMAAMRAEKATTKLTRLLMRHEGAWPWVREDLRRWPDPKTHGDLRSRLLEILALDPDPKSHKLLAAELERDPGAFPRKALMRLDSHGNKAARTRLVRVVAGKPGFANLDAAIHLGLSGDKASRDVLVWARDKSALMKRFDSKSYGVALALHRIGDSGAWKTLRRRAVESIANANDFATARWFAVQLEFYSKLAKRKKVDVATLDFACSSFVESRSAEVRTKDDLETLLRGCGLTLKQS